MKNILEFSKQLLLENLSSDSIVVDATVGNGNDTLFLCENFKFVYGFDIQSEAIEVTKSKLFNYNNFRLIEDSHSNISSYVKQCNGAIFNLGYLPYSDSILTTKYETTIKAIKCLLSIMKSGIIILVLYTGHDNFEEAREVEMYTSKLSTKYKVVKYQFINKKSAPYIIAIKF